MNYSVCAAVSEIHKGYDGQLLIIDKAMEDMLLSKPISFGLANEG
jgi:hypothetical protein